MRNKCVFTVCCLLTSHSTPHQLKSHPMFNLILINMVAQTLNYTLKCWRGEYYNRDDLKESWNVHARSQTAECLTCTHIKPKNLYVIVYTNITVTAKGKRESQNNIASKSVSVSITGTIDGCFASNMRNTSNGKLKERIISWDEGKRHHLIGKCYTMAALPVQDPLL